MIVDEENIFHPAYSDDDNSFKEALPKRKLKLNHIPRTLDIEGRLLHMNNKNKYAQYIYSSVLDALRSDWYNNLCRISKISCISQVQSFFKWLLDKNIIIENKLTLLNEYEAYRVNSAGVKSQSTGLSSIMNTINIGISSNDNKVERLIYIKSLIDNTNISLNDERDPSSIADFFATMPWLRAVIGERDYLKLESPKLIMNSFSITVASTLLNILQIKKQVITYIDDINRLGEKGKNLQKKERQAHWCLDLMLLIGKLSKYGKPENDITELLLLDFINDDMRDTLLDRWHKYGKDKISLKLIVNGKYRSVFSTPSLFSEDHIMSIGPIEELLCSWLCAWLAIQPSDIRKLKRNDFIVQTNKKGRGISIQCQYYKGRSSYENEPLMLNSNSIEGLALQEYLHSLPFSSSKLFNISHQSRVKLTFSSHVNLISRISRIWESDKFNKYIISQLNRRNSSSLFLKAFISIKQNGSMGYCRWSYWRNKNKKSSCISSYRDSVEKPMPQIIFGLRAIKNSSVYSRSDKYRENDLINYNSHTSSTEKACYLTDKNKEWVNQNGRITRMVLHDIENYVYKPNINASLHDAHNQLLRTQVINITNTLNLSQNNINALGQCKTQITLTDIESDDILILDSPETVVNMMHYISEAERQYSALIQRALVFFEKTVLPNVEWMHYCLEQLLSPSIVKQGEQSYMNIRSILPPLFSQELNGGVTA